MPFVEKRLQKRFITPGTLPNLAEWVDRMWKLDAVKQWALDDDTHAKYINSYLAGKANYDLA